MAAGLALAVVRSFAIRPLNWLIIFLVDLFRALPPLVIIALLYFGLPAAGLSLSGFAATWLSLSLVLMAFTEEIFWAGITAVPRGSGRRRAPPGSALPADPAHGGAAAGAADGDPAADQPHHRHHQGHRAGQRGGGAGDPWARRRPACSFSFNPTPLTLGAIAYVVLFLPVVILGRWVETRFA